MSTLTERTILDRMQHPSTDEAIGTLFWMGPWTGALTLAAEEAIRRGLSPEAAGHAIAFAVEALTPKTSEGIPHD